MKKKLLSMAMTVAVTAFGVAAQAQTTIYGLTTTNGMFTMTNANNPSSINGPYSVSGVTSNQVLVGLDTRPDDGDLYALGYDTTSGAVQLYRITNSGSNGFSASAVGSSTGSLDLGNNMNNSNATRHLGFNFISTTGTQIRILGNNGYSYVMSAVDGSVSSTGNSGYNYGSGSSLYAGLTANVVATTYSNNYYGSDAADQVGYDLTNNAVVSFESANYGNGYGYTPSTVYFTGLSGLLFDANSNIGLDSWYDTATHHNTIYLTGTALLGTGAHLYTIGNSGLATDHGAIGNGNLNVQAIATSVDQYSSSSNNNSAEGQTMAGLSLNLRNLILFDSYNPNHITGMHHITGMTSGQTMIALNYGQNLQLYGLGYNSTNQSYQLYNINEQTGAATAVNQTPGNINLGSDNGSGSNLNVAFSFMADATNRIRVIGNNGNTNDQLDATTGLVVSQDGALQYGSTDNNNGQMANIGSVAYTNNYSGSNSTEMVGLDFNTGYMVSFDGNDSNSNSSANNDLSSLLNLSVMLNLSLINNNNHNNNNGYLDIYYDANTSANLGYIATNYYGDSDNTENYGVLYGTTASGASFSNPAYVGSIGSGTPMKSMSAKKTYNPLAVSNVANNTNSNLLVYPNPVVNSANILLPQAAANDVMVSVLDLSGRVVGSYQYPAGSSQLNINMGSMPAGMYNVRVSQTGNATQNLKVVKY